MSARIPHSHFSTDTVGPELKFDAWREQLSTVFDPHLPDHSDPHKFKALVSGHLFGSIAHLRAVAAQQHFVRDRRKIDADGVDNYMIQVFRRGGCLATTGKGEIEMKPGDICIFDNANPLDSYNSDFDLVSMFVPRELLAPLITNADGRHLSKIDAREPMAVILRNHLFALHESAPNLSSEAGELLVKPTLSLLAATMNGSPASADGGENAMRFAQATTIKRYVDRNLHDSKLNAEALRQIFGVSRARLYRLFAAYDGVAHYIRNRRLGAAVAILRSPNEQHRKIIDIAYSVGFGSEGSFIRAFRRRYGYTPAESRFSSKAPGASKIGKHDVGDTTWSEWMRSLQT